MEKILKKLSSRKFWMALAGVATGVAVAFGVDSGAIATVAGAVTAVLSVASYVVTEGRIDAAAVEKTAQQLQEAAQTLGQDGYAGGDGC